MLILLKKRKYYAEFTLATHVPHPPFILLPLLILLFLILLFLILLFLLLLILNLLPLLFLIFIFLLLVPPFFISDISILCLPFFCGVSPKKLILYDSFAASPVGSSSVILIYYSKKLSFLIH
jgi:hypothetical protein